MQLNAIGCLNVFVFLVGLFLVQTNCSDLKALFVFFRDGNRAPDFFYQNDPHGNLAAWPNGLGQLSKMGEEQTAKIGEFLRKIYLDLVIQDIDQIEIRSMADVKRVRKSAENVFKAFVTDSPLEKSSPFILFERELTVQRIAKCPALNEELQRLGNQPSHQEIARRNGEFKGAFLDDADALHKFLDTFQFELNEGFELPSWLTPELHEKLEWFDAEFYNRWCSTKRMVRICAGSLFDDFSNKIQKLVKSEGSSPDYDFGKINDGPKTTKKLNLYGCDDITLNNFLVGLQAFDPIQHLPPPPASTLIIELHQTANRSDLNWNESSFVRVLFFKETVHPIMSEPYILQNVTVRTFLSSISDVSLDESEWLKACLNLDSFHSDSCSDRTVLLVIIVVLAVVLVVLLLITLCIGYRNKKKLISNPGHQ